MFGAAGTCEIAARCDAAAEALAQLADIDTATTSEAELAVHLPTLHRLRATLDAAIVDAVATFDGRKQWALDGAFSASGWLAPRVGTTRASAAATVKVARQARHMPHAMDQARAGNLSADKLRTLATARAVSERTAKEYDDDETRLVDEITHRDVETGARLLRSWVAAADPDADDDAHTDRDQKRKVNLSTSLHGMGFLDGLLTTEANAILRSQLEAITGDLHRWGLSTSADGTRLTAAQLRHDALVEMARRAAASATAVDVRRDAKHRADDVVAARDACAADPAGSRRDEPADHDDRDPVDGCDGHGGDDAPPPTSSGGTPTETWGDTRPTPDPATGPSGPTTDTRRRREGPGRGAGPATDAPVRDAGLGPTDDHDQAARRPHVDRLPALLGPDDLDDDGRDPGPDDEPPGDRGACSHQTGAQGLLLPPGLPPPGAGPPLSTTPDDKVAGGLGRPLFTVLIDLDTLEGRRPHDLLTRRADAVGVGPLAPTDIRRHLCDAGISRVVTRGRSLPLDVGAVSRTATPAQWRALIAHSPTCEFPWCTAPWEWCEAHHLDHWTATRRTALDGLALECTGHHHLLHRPGWTMTRRPDLTTEVTRPDGTTLTA